MNASRYDSVNAFGSAMYPAIDAATPTRPMPSALVWSEAIAGGAWRSAAFRSLMLRGSFVARFRGRVVRAFGGGGLPALEARLLFRRQVADARVLAELQRADVGDDRPAILRRDLRGVVRHLAEPARHHVEEVARALVAQPGVVVRRRALVAAL